MDFQEIIARRRDGLGNTREDLKVLASGAADGSIPDYQLAAWLMAEYLRPLNEEETAGLTLAMANSGERLDMAGLPKPWVDKHSTGGVGDKTTLILLPLLASCGMTIVKMSGRGLGITGGTVDKLESVPGFRMDLTPEELKAQAASIGVAITGQSASLAPADKALYALRDVTATVDSIPLLVSSIMSKKIAGGSECVVLDVKCGSGGFMRDLEGATRLAEALIETGRRAGLPAHVVITDMSQPLGRAVGNLLEVKEAVEVLKGAPGRVRDLCLQLAAHALMVSGLAPGEKEGLAMASAALREGRALRRAKEWFKAQGATVDVFDHPEALPVAPFYHMVKNPHGTGFVARVDAGTVGETVVRLGGGREKKTDDIDPTVGVEVFKSVGDPVVADEEIFAIHARNKAGALQAEKLLLGAFAVSETPVESPQLILKMMG